MDDGFLHKYFLSNAGKCLHKWMHYIDIYERHLSRFRNASPVMVEIGVFKGGSLDMWSSYFGEGAKIIGIDINPDCAQFARENIDVFIGSQDDPALIGRVLAKHPSIDIVLDDGSHVMNHMISTFNMLYPRVSENGVYMVEDVHTSYLPDYGGGLKRSGSFMEFVKDKLDEINANWCGDQLPISDFTRSTDSISVYDSIVVFEKRRQGRRQAPMTEAM